MRQTYNLEWASKDLGQDSRVALGNVYGGGNVEIVVGSTASSGQESYLHIFRYKGQTYNQLAKMSLGKNNTNWIGCHDIDKDGIDEIVIGCSDGIHIYKIRGGKLVRIAKSVDVKGAVICIAIADIDKDGKYEVIAVVKGKPRIYIFRFEKDLTLWKSETIEQQVYCVAAGDTDNDGYPEIVVKSHGQRGCIINVLCYKGGKRHEKWRSHISDAGKAFLAVDDFDLDGKAEIVLDCTDGKVRVMQYDGSKYRTFWDSPKHSQGVQNVAIFDIDGDGYKELIVVCLSEVYIYSWKAGRIILEWTQTVPNGAFCIAAGELNHKGFGEIVVGTVYGYIYVFEARRDKQRGKLWMDKVQAIIQDTVTIPDGKPDAARGVEAKAKFFVDEVRVIHDKVIVDGTVKAKVLYVAALPSQPVHFFEATFPFLEFIHLHGAKHGMQAFVYFNVEHISVDVVSPRRIKITILFEMVVKLVPFYDDHHHKDHFDKDHFHKDHFDKDHHKDYYHKDYDDHYHKDYWKWK
ncbi:MAG: FG-GAP-like repeat-containing protein [Tepidanaerobacteraceae bacterium]|nr:DUF3794 domain-containing protein [Thermoanaerobacterales bacterium]